MAKIRRQAAEWASLIDQWRHSGTSLPACCQRHGLSRGTMQNWVYKPSLRRAAEQAGPIETSLPDPPTPQGPSPAFLPIRIAEVSVVPRVPDRAGVEVVLGPGRRIAVAPSFDLETLRPVVAVVEDRPC